MPRRDLAAEAGAKKLAERNAEVVTAKPLKQEEERGKGLGEAGAKAEAKLPGADEAVAEEKAKVGEALAHPGFSSTVGASWRPGARFLDGTDEASFMTRHGQITSGTFLKAFESLRGGGQITEIEGKKATEAFNRMSIASSEKEYKAAAEDYMKLLDAILARTKATAALGKSTGKGKKFNPTTGVWEDNG
jgi:hypothetical protein